MSLFSLFQSHSNCERLFYPFHQCFHTAELLLLLFFSFYQASLLFRFIFCRASFSTSPPQKRFSFFIKLGALTVANWTKLDFISVGMIYVQMVSHLTAKNPYILSLLKCSLISCSHIITIKYQVKQC